MVGQALDGALAARFPEGQDPLANIALDSASMSGLLVPFEGTAHLRQGRIAYAGLAGIIIGFAALVPSRRRDVWPWALIAAVGLLLSLGPHLRLDDTEVGSFTLPMAWLIDAIPSLLAYRMPIRFLALVFLGLGALVALLLHQMRIEGLGLRWRSLLVALLLIDGLWFTGAMIDETRATAEVPDGYEELSGRGAVMDLWGHDRNLLRYSGLSAFYQVHHGQPAMTDFTQAVNAQSVLSRRFGLALVQQDVEEVNEIVSLLQALGVTDIAFHPDSFQDRDQTRIRGSLNSISENQVTAIRSEVTNRVEVFYLPEPNANIDRDQARRTILEWIERESR